MSIIFILCLLPLWFAGFAGGIWIGSYIDSIKQSLPTERTPTLLMAILSALLAIFMMLVIILLKWHIKNV